MSYFDPATNQKYVPYVIEPSLGADRVALAFLCAAYDEEEIAPGDVRTVLRFSPALAPVKIAVLPLSGQTVRQQLSRSYHQLGKSWSCEFDDRQSIGKRYRRQDEIGTPYCVTFDFDSLEDQCVTIRERDSMAAGPASRSMNSTAISPTSLHLKAWSSDRPLFLMSMKHSTYTRQNLRNSEWIILQQEDQP